jgi:uncharacterized protein
VVTGFTKVEAAIENRQIALILHANDASAEGTRKVAQALRRKFGAHGPPEINLFASCQLDLALGRANVVHAALKAEPASRAFLVRCRRLAVYRSTGLVDEPQIMDMAPETGSGVLDDQGLTPGTQE